LFITFVGPRTKCKLFIYDVFVFLTHLMLFWQLCIYCLFSMVPWAAMHRGFTVE
jgi:hypothetical protein